MYQFFKARAEDGALKPQGISSSPPLAAGGITCGALKPLPMPSTPSRSIQSLWGLLWCSRVKNSSAKARDTGLCPGLERAHTMRWLSLCAATALCPECPGVRAPQPDKPLQWEAKHRTQRVAPCSSQLGKSACSSEDQAQPKILLNQNLDGMCKCLYL